MEKTISTDVAIVGASLAGSAAARMFADAGLDVTLIEKHSDPNAYKSLCGHFIQSCSRQVFDRLGISEQVEAEGGVRNGVDIHTEWGWIRPAVSADKYGYSIRRSKLDPLIRAHAIAAPRVSFLGGQTAIELADGEGERRRLTVRDRSGKTTAIDARVVVGADGRNSKIAELAGSRERRRENNRFCYMGYYEGIDLPGKRARVWIGENTDVTIASPNDDGLTLLALFPNKERLGPFKEDREGAFEALVDEIPHEGVLDGRRRAAKYVGYTDYAPIERQPHPAPGVALIGDAALCCDPLLAIGCGWALQSASWLVDEVAPALLGERSLRRGLRAYAREHRRRLSGHARMLNAGAKALPPNPIERTLFAAATRDERAASTMDRFLSREIPVRRFLSPINVARSALINARAEARA